MQIDQTVVAIIVLISLFGIVVGFFLNGQNVLKKKILAIQEEKESTLNKYSKARCQIDIPDNYLTVYYFQTITIANKTINEKENYICIKDDSIYFFPTTFQIDFYFKIKHNLATGGYLESNREEMRILGGQCPQDFELFSIKIQNILSFEKSGERYHETQISGGGGGGSSIGNAIIGGVIAGGAGAIVASRKKNNPITSKFIEHDEIACILSFKYENKRYNLAFDHEDYKKFKELIPNKDIYVIDEIRRKQAVEEHINNEIDIMQEIKKLATLKDDGIITQQEFEELKRKFLNKL